METKAHLQALKDPRLTKPKPRRKRKVVSDTGADAVLLRKRRARALHAPNISPIPMGPTPAPLLTVALGVGPTWSWQSSEPFPTFHESPSEVDEDEVRILPTEAHGTCVVEISDSENGEHTPPSTDASGNKGNMEVEVDKASAGSLLVYGVSGHHRIFRSHARALKVFHETPGADFFFTYNEEELVAFIVKEEVRMKV
ncbi:hypothetical protein B0H17DRAFT_1213664 [Mycena rosella]|uniref:Uncharacterized protein n=1 Tax=Mycena rosella TaxID=1033263 RepID=A0AAD7CPU5_MYCRO|nr:hypothetical protein B0H17DRAFT_1213664 [Mycena rosella]